MECKEFRRISRHGFKTGDGDSIRRSELAAHAEQCERCRREAAIENLASALVKTCTVEAGENQYSASPYLIVRIKARIRELSGQGVNSWESAVLSLRGWLVAFGAVAVLLLTLSVQWQLSSTASANDNDNDMTVLLNISDDIISGNIYAPPRPSEKLKPANEAANDANK